MGYNARMNPQSARTGDFASVPTSSSEIRTLFAAERAGHVLGAVFWNGTTSSVASGTTAASAMNVYVYLNASDTTASNVASARLGQVATLGTTALTLNSSSALNRFAAGDILLAEIIGGAGNSRNNAGATVQLNYMYAHASGDDTSP